MQPFRGGAPARASRFFSGAFGLALAAGLVGCSDATPAGGTSGANSSGASGTAGAQSGGTSGTVAGAGASAGTQNGVGASGSATTGTQNSAVSGNAAGSGGTADAGTADGATTDAASPDGDSAAGGLTLPVQRGALDVLEFGSLAFAVNPSIGARVVSFKFDGDELLTDATANARYYGSTLWTSPAGDWVPATGFDPPAVVDRDLYTTTVSTDGVITATSAPYATPNGKKFTVKKVFTADIANQAIVIDYTITNTGTTAFQLSHWEVTRVFPGGLTFFPAGNTVKANFLTQVMNLQQAQRYTWYDDTTHVAGKGEGKAGSDSMGGFIAQDAPHPKGDLLFVKAFKVVAPAAAPPAPDNFAIELYATDAPTSSAHTYVELEEYSAYTSIAPSATYTHTVHWYLRRLPMGTDRSVGSAALIAAANAVLGK
jgi:hypothetical protein